MQITKVVTPLPLVPLPIGFFCGALFYVFFFFSFTSYFSIASLFWFFFVSAELVPRL